MTDRTRLGQMILDHWRETRPRMVKELEKAKRLDQAVAEAQERSGDLLYEMVSERGLDYQAAWELAMEEWALTPMDSHPPSSRSRRRNPPRNPSRRRRGTSG